MRRGKVILPTAAAFDLAIVDSFFPKKSKHVTTYKSGQTSSQIDYILNSLRIVLTDAQFFPAVPSKIKLTMTF